MKESANSQEATITNVLEDRFATGYEALVNGVELLDPNGRHVF